MRNIILAAALIAMPVEAAVQHATGTFEVKMTPRTGDLPEGLARMVNIKTFAGGFAGASCGDMLTAMGGVEGSAAYVLIERLTGTLDGRSGSFVLMHSATMDRGTPDQRITVVPDSGTGALTGLKGAMTIRIEDGKHFYDLAYELPN
ncbi:DUF3224 domain-containing protein [Glacieibacterium frigidum]|uniref:DUF3224 domain-containing protein n=1 Tax=Glacieibacterium frigidum TaxID=2593303 RepID=A0A552UGN8_9SPHN|nr:DUF3224 domain-containing protein [Glacieibacterium frigidum]TRW17388.1 DUF3224 domain-containing protein [Glacieibacterium frigidum]